jgi:hypothetical protein
VVFLAIAVAVVSLTGVFAAEHIGVHDGFGWDGVMYRAIMRDPLTQLLGREVDSYTLQRVIPSALVGGTFALFDVEQTGARVARAFGIYNATLLVACALLWTAAARMLGASRRAFYVGAAALFLNFAMTKQVSYYPVLTDTTAYAISLALIVAFLARSTVAVAAIAFIGAFCWPVVLPLALPLIIWPREVVPVKRTGEVWIAILVAGGITLAILSLFGYLHYGLGRIIAGKGPVAPVVPTLVPLSMLSFGAMAFGALYFLLRGIDLSYVRMLFKELRTWRLACALSVAGTVIGIVSILAARDVAPPLPLRTFLGMLAITPLTRPLISVVAHVSYFGPWIVLLIAFWPRVTLRIQREGAGLLAFACGATILAFLPESREAIFGIPLLAVYFALASDELSLTRGAIVVLVAAAVLTTRFWVRYGESNTASFVAYRRYLSTHGPYMTNADYVAFGAFAMIVAVALALTLRRAGRPASRPVT